MKDTTLKKLSVCAALFLSAVCVTAFAQAAGANPPASGTADDTFNWLVNWNNKLLGAPSGVLVIVLLFLFDSVLYYAEFFPNRNVPVFSIVVGGAVYSLICIRPADTAMPLYVWIAKNVVFGCIFGAAAWVLALRYGMKLVLKAAGKPDPAPPLPPTDAPQKIEVEIVSKPNESNTPKNP